MSDRSKIEWTDASWNPLRARRHVVSDDGATVLPVQLVGWHCEHVTTACANCYAEGINNRLGTKLPYKPGHRADLEFFLDEKTLLQPLHWRKPRKIFVCSMTDLFGDWVTDDQLDRIFAVMALCPQHTFIVLTKRPERMREYMLRRGPTLKTIASVPQIGRDVMTANTDWPLPNVWLLVSICDQPDADKFIPILLDTPAAVRGVSVEPLLGHVALHALNLATPSPSNALQGVRCVRDDSAEGYHNENTARLDWVIVGGESGPSARPMHPQWARDIRDWCAAAAVAYFFKQWGGWLPVEVAADGSYEAYDNAVLLSPDGKQCPRDQVKLCDFPNASILMERVGKKRAGRLLDGVEHSEFPQVRA